jgi:hypothetical protein
MNMRFFILFVLFSAFGAGCNQDNQEIDALAEIVGVWTIDQINYQFCNKGFCEDNVTDFSSSGLTFEIRRDSVFYYPFANFPEMREAFAIRYYVYDTLKLENKNGIWDFVLTEKQAKSMTVVNTIVVDDVTFNDVISVSR